jgi:hypothetical protein
MGSVKNLKDFLEFRLFAALQLIGPELGQALLGLDVA